ncbi:MAG: DedA family protein [Gammaproteobacteria bacterium]
MFQELQDLIQNYGYVIVFLWAFIEGEVGMVLAGSVAHQGYLEYRFVALTAFIGGFLGDQFYFWLGRYYGHRVFERFPRLAKHAGKARDLLERYNTPFILTNRFMYGVRVAGPIVVGTTSISGKKFFWLNMVSAIVWAISITGLGYAFAEAVELVIDDIRTAEKILVGAIAGIGTVLWLYYRWREQRTHKRRAVGAKTP